MMTVGAPHGAQRSAVAGIARRPPTLCDNGLGCGIGRLSEDSRLATQAKSPQLFGWFFSSSATTARFVVPVTDPSKANGQYIIQAFSALWPPGGLFVQS